MQVRIVLPSLFFLVLSTVATAPPADAQRLCPPVVAAAGDVCTCAVTNYGSAPTANPVQLVMTDGTGAALTLVSVGLGQPGVACGVGNILAAGQTIECTTDTVAPAGGRICNCISNFPTTAPQRRQSLTVSTPAAAGPPPTLPFTPRLSVECTP